MKTLFLILSMSMISACTEYKSKNLNPVPHKEDGLPLVDTLQGQYLAPLSPMNEQVAGNVSGGFTFSHEGDELVADLRFAGGPGTAKIIHAQSIHAGNRCPTMEDDLNLDGFIDAVEAERAIGKVLIPLDADISAQHLGLGIFPVADDFGGYIWSQLTSFDKLVTDLREEDINPEDSYVKLHSEKFFNFEGLIVVVKGVAETAPLPESVQTNDLLASHQSLPVACGVIKKVVSVPGSREDDVSTIPFPEGGNTPKLDDGAYVEVPDRTLIETETRRPSTDFPTLENYGDDEESSGGL